MTLIANFKDDFDNYCGTSLADFYISPAHRLLVYAVTFIFTGLAAFGAMTVYDFYNDLIKVPLDFKGIHAWNTAANFALSLCIVDILIAWLVKSWGSYDRRTVGKAWVIFFVAYLVGFAAYRVIAYKLMVLYSPEIIWTYELNPSQRPGPVSSFMFLLPFELVIAYGVMQIILSMQARSEELLQVRIDAILGERARQAELCPELAAQTAAKRIPASDGHLQLPTDSGVGPIRPSDIGHVTVEDHYLRIFYQKDNGLENTLIRMPLKELSTRLPDEQFVLIHRSHMVNLDRISRLKRSGRAVRLSMKHGDFELPVSRYRLPQLLPVLEKFLNT